MRERVLWHLHGAGLKKAVLYKLSGALLPFNSERKESKGVREAIERLRFGKLCVMFGKANFCYLVPSSKGLTSDLSQGDWYGAAVRGSDCLRSS